MTKVATNKLKIMGVLNVTPDSFSDGGEYFNSKKAAVHARTLLELGADILDIGGQSTRPGYIKISASEELARVEPVFKLLGTLKKKPEVISVDTFYPEVADFASKSGAGILNLTFGFNDPKLLQIAKYHNMVCIINYCGEAGLANSFFEDQIKLAKQYKIPDNNLILDPGIGFDKTFLEDFEIIKNPKKFCPNGYQIMVGISRKRVTRVLLNLINLMSTNICDVDFKLRELVNNHREYLGRYFAENLKEVFVRLEADEVLRKIAELKRYCDSALTEREILDSDSRDVITGVLNNISLKNGADIVRVHNVKMTKKILNLLNTRSSTGNS